MTDLFLVEGRVRIRFHELQTRLIQALRSKPIGVPSTREELEAAVYPQGCRNKNLVDQIIFKLNRRRPGLVILDRGHGWCLDPLASWGEYEPPKNRAKAGAGR